MTIYRALVIAIAILCITILEVIALCNGHDGAGIVAATAAISSLSTYAVARKLNK